jgi:hypothetical protein
MATSLVDVKALLMSTGWIQADDRKKKESAQQYCKRMAARHQRREQLGA